MNVAIRCNLLLLMVWTFGSARPRERAKTSEIISRHTIGVLGCATLYQHNFIGFSYELAISHHLPMFTFFTHVSIMPINEFAGELTRGFPVDFNSSDYYCLRRFNHETPSRGLSPQRYISISEEILPVISSYIQPGVGRFEI
jgi:hypothetical protein